MNEVRVGQFYADQDKRMAGRVLLVKEVDEKYAYLVPRLRPDTKQRTRVRLDRLQTSSLWKLFDPKSLARAWENE